MSVNPPPFPFELDTLATFVPQLTSGYVSKVIHADTLVIVGSISNKWYQLNVRVRGIYSPSLRSKSSDVRTVAQKAHLFVKLLVQDRTVELLNMAYDKYGRLEADVKIGNSLDLAKALIQTRLAVAHKGWGRRPKVEWVTYHSNTIK